MHAGASTRTLAHGARAAAAAALLVLAAPEGGAAVLQEIDTFGTALDPDTPVLQGRTELNAEQADFVGYKIEVFGSSVVWTTIKGVWDPFLEELSDVKRIEPGVYTVIGSAADDSSTGVILVEVYVVP